MTEEATDGAFQAPTPNADLASLERLLGTWTVSDPSGAGAVSGTVRYEWMSGGFFLLQHVDLEQFGMKVNGIEIIGHAHPFGAEESGDITSRYYDSMGNTFDYTYEIEGNVLTIWGGEKGSPAYYRGTFSSDGNSNTGGWVYPGGGGYESTMNRVAS